MTKVDTLGIDIAKKVFQLHGVDRRGRMIFKRRVMRDQLLLVLEDIDRCTIAIEACNGSTQPGPSSTCNGRAVH